MTQKIAKAQKGDLVKVQFTCKLDDGTIYDTSEGKEPLQFTIGEGEVFAFLDEAVLGLSQNQIKTVTVPAEKVFGPYLDEKKQVISRDEFPEHLNPEVGLQFQITQENGKTSVITVTDITDSNVTLSPNHPLAGKNLSFRLQLVEFEQSDKSRAEDLFKEGIAFQNDGQLDDAIQSYKKVIDLNPNHSGAYYNLGVAFQKQDRIDQAILYYEIAIGLNANLTEAHHNLGLAYKEKGQLDDAIICFQRVLQLQPNHANAHYNLGNTLVAEGRFSEALLCFNKALEIDPDHADAHWSKGLINLRLGNFAEGWKGYEWRWRLTDIMPQRDFTQPVWDGSDLKGRIILLHAEQGFGDTIQFIRYVPLVSERGAKVIIECQKELVSLLRNVEGVDAIIAYGETLPAFDVHCPLLSLPLLFDTTIDTIPSKIPYISANPALIEEWHNRISSDESAIKIGLVWAGDPKLKFGHSRSCSLEAFSSLAAIPHIIFYSLTKGESAEQAQHSPDGMQIIDLTEDAKDFSDTAALIENLDLIISVDTAVAHLAGALGKPVWTLLPFVPDWRWMLDREDSPWYPTMKLFRQQSSGDWGAVIELVKEKLVPFFNK